jgi:hypothetical protein
MKFADRLKFTATGTSASTITVGSAITGCRTPAQAIADGAIAVSDANVPFTTADDVGNWEDALFTVTSSTVLTRTQVLASSAGGTTAATFTGSSLTVFNCVPGSMMSRVPIDRDVSFSQSIPLDQLGITWMAQQTVAAKYTFTPAASAVKGAMASGRLVADGVIANAPDTSAFKTIGGTAAYNNVAGSVNLWEAAYDGYNYWWAWAQEGSTASAGSGSSGADTTAPVMAGSLSSSGITSGGYTLTWSTASDNVGVASYEVSTNGGISYSNVGSVTTWAATGMAANTAYSNMVRAVDAAGNKATPLSLTVTTLASSDSTVPTMNGSITVSAITQTGYALSWSAGSDNVGVTGYEYSLDGGTSWNNAGNVLTVSVTGRSAGATDQVRVRDYDAAGNRGTALSASVTMLAATAPDAPTIGTATPGDTTASFAFSAPASNGGSAINNYTLTVYNASTNAVVGTFTGPASPIGATGLADGTGYYGKVAATNTAGTGAQSAASNSVIPAAADWPRLTSLSTTTMESGTGPYTYTGGGTALASEKGGLTTKKIASGTSGRLRIKILNATDSVEVGFRNVQSTNVYTSQLSGFYTTAGAGAVSGAYRIVGGANNANAPAAGDEIEVGRDTASGAWKVWLYRNGTGSGLEIMSWTTAYNSGDIWLDVVCASSASVQLLSWTGFV